MGKKKELKMMKKKKSVVFDEEDRKAFLTGFRKRKMERKMKGKEIIDKKIKEEKKRLKDQQKNRINQLYLNDRDVPEVAHLLEPISYEFENHSVNVTSIDTTNLTTNLGLTMGVNRVKERKENSDDGNDTATEVTDLKTLRKEYKREQLKTIKNSSAFKAKQKEKHSKDIKAARHKRKMFKRQEKLGTKKKTLKKRSNKTLRKKTKH